MPTLTVTIDLAEADYQTALMMPQGELRLIVADAVNTFAVAKNIHEVDEDDEGPDYD